MDTIDKETGFTEQEKDCHDSLLVFYAKFLKLETQHPDELRDIADAIHRIQEKLSMRITRRAFPEGWPVYRKRYCSECEKKTEHKKIGEYVDECCVCKEPKEVISKG